MFSLTTLLFTHYYSNKGWVHKWLFSGEHRGPSELQLRTLPQTRRTEGEGNEQIKAMIDNTTGAVSSWFLPPINRFNQCHLNWADTDATGFLAYDYFSPFMKKHCIYIRDTCMSHALFIISLSHSMCVCFSSLVKAGLSRQGKAFCKWIQTSMLKWGLRESVVEATAKSERSRTHYPPASARANAPQRRQLVRNSFCLSLSHFPCCWATFINLNCQPTSLLCLHSLSLCLFYLCFSGSSGERQPLHWDCRSLSLYIYSYYSCCER